MDEKKGQRADSKAVAVTAGNWRNFAEGKLAVVIKSGLVLAEFPRPFFPGQALLRGPPTSSLRLHPTTFAMHDDGRELGGRSDEIMRASFAETCKNFASFQFFLPLPQYLTGKTTMGPKTI